MLIDLRKISIENPINYLEMRTMGEIQIVGEGVISGSYKANEVSTRVRRLKHDHPTNRKNMRVYDRLQKADESPQ